MKNLYLYLGIYIAILITIALSVRKKEDSEDFLISGRNRHGVQILLSKFAGAVGASWFIAYTAYAYEFGWGIFGAIVGAVVSYLVFAYWAAPKIYEHSREHKFYTQGDYAYHCTKSPLARTITNLITIVAQFGLLLIGIVGGAKVMSHFGLISYNAAVILTSIVVLVYLLIAGFKAVIITDVFQGIIIFCLMGIITFSLINQVDFSQIWEAHNKSIDVGTLIGFWVYGFFAVFAYADRYQLCYAARNKKHLSHAMAFACIPICIVLTALLVIGLFVYLQNPNLDPDLAFIEALKTYLPANLVPLSIVLFFAGLMSNADTNVYATSSHIILHKKGAENKAVSHIRITIIILVLLSLILSLIFRNIVDITILASSLAVTLSVPMIYLISGGTNSNRFNGSALAGLAALTAGTLYLGAAPVLIALVVVGGAIGLLYNKS